MGRIRVSTVISSFILLQCVSSAVGSDDSPWYKDLCSYKWEAIDQDNNVRYSLKLCVILLRTECGKGSVVCAHNLTSGQHQSVAGAIGACGQINGKNVNLGYVQSNLQAAPDGSISIVYLNGDKCSSGRYSTRIIFQCDDSPGAPMFDRKDGCEYVFIWRTSEACPIKRVQGENCKVKEETFLLMYLHLTHNTIV